MPVSPHIPTTVFDTVLPVALRVSRMPLPPFGAWVPLGVTPIEQRVIVVRDAIEKMPW